MKNYKEIKSFKNLYLEDSFVLNILETEHKLIFEMDIILTENHELYETPQKGEIYCFKKGRIKFEGISNVKWINKSIDNTYKDVNGEIDYGNIDNFEFENELYLLEGDWGEIEISSDLLKIEVD